MPAEVSTDTVAIARPASAEGKVRLRHRRWASWVTSTLLVAVIGSAVLDGVDLVEVWGVDEATVAAVAPDGERLAVTHPTVTRPALASPFVIEVSRPGGWDGDVEIAIDIHYLELWDLNGISPSPAEERSDGDRVVWTFDPPDGSVLRVSYDARIEPGAQLTSRRGAVSLLDGGEPRLTVRFTTKVRP